jgi:heme-degrading monooxygenase HmoA
MTFYTSGEWIVKPGAEAAFFDAFRRSGVDDLDPPLEGLLQRPILLRDLKTEGRFVSFGEWESLEAIDVFRHRPDWQAMVGAMREHLVASNIYTFERVI